MMNRLELASSNGLRENHHNNLVHLLLPTLHTDSSGVSTFVR